MIRHQQASFEKEERTENCSLSGEVNLGRKERQRNSPSDVYYDLPIPLRIMASGLLVRLKGKPIAEDLWSYLPLAALGIGCHETSLTQVLGQRGESCNSVGQVERSG